jgi:hypothetical protein
MKEVRVRVRVRSSKIEVRCESACGSIIEVRVCVRHTVKFLATQHLDLLITFSHLPGTFAYFFKKVRSMWKVIASTFWAE